ncbi:MAG: hypothetical protein O7C73_00435, partial [Nitrospirae bacterium]|nr:hypothetical protein [Nitrospirota bacterium]
MRKSTVGMLVAVIGLAVVAPPAAWTTETLPVEPELTLRLDEHYDHESHMFLMLFSLKGDGEVDYVTGRMVQKHMRSHYGNPVYYTEPFPLFYWWNHTLWNDPTEDGVNGNERVYQENIEFDVTRFKPC